MAKISIKLGEINVFVMGPLVKGQYLPIGNLANTEKEKVVISLVEKLEYNLSSRFEGTFQIEITGIYDGCIKSKLVITWIVTSALLSGIAGYPALKAGARELWDNGRAGFGFEFEHDDRDYTAIIADDNLIIAIHRSVKKNDTLSEIVHSMDCGHVSNKQKMVAIYLHNPQAFIDQNMNLLKEGVILIIPSTKEIQKISPERAKKLYQDHQLKFKNK